MAQPDRLLIRGGRVFDGLSQELQQRDILVEGARIAAVGPGLEADATVFDASGKWITPGLIDMHVHLWNLGMEALPAIVGHGVTTVRDLGSHWTWGTFGVGGDARRVRQIKLDVEAGKVVGPNVIYAGPVLHQANPAIMSNAAMRAALAGASGDPGSRPIETAEEARAAVTYLIEAQGVGTIKIYESVRNPVTAAILEAAAGRVPVTGHLALTSSTFAMEHGIGGLEHVSQSPIRDLAPAHRRIDPDDWLGVPGYVLTVLRAWADVDLNGPEVERWLRTLLDSGAFLDPTITVDAARPKPGDPRCTLFPTVFGSSAVPRPASADRGDVRVWAGEAVTSRARANQRGLIQLIYEHGGDLVVGTDLLAGALPGWSYHAELAALQRRGMKPIDILYAATSVAARHLWRDDLGRIAPKARADLVVMSKDPTLDITDISSITHVVKGGAVYESAKLLALTPAASA